MYGFDAATAPQNGLDARDAQITVNVASVPEPTPLVLLGLGSVALAGAGRLRRRAG